MSIKWKGLNEFRRRLEDSRADALKDLGRALFVEGERIMTVSKRDFVPIDFGTLYSSAQVRKPHFRGTRAEVLLGYGGAASAYALAIHEHPSKHSPPSWEDGVSFNVGGPKYLERPVNDAAKGLAERLGRHLELFE